MQNVEEPTELRDEVFLEIVVPVDGNAGKSVRTQTNDDAFGGKARGFVCRTSVGNHHDAKRAYHASVVDAELIVLAPESFDDRVDHDQVFDLWCCQFCLQRYHVEEFVESSLACPKCSTGQ